MAIKFLSNESIDGTLEVGSFTVSGSGIVAAVGMTLQVDAGGVNAITIDNVGTVTTSGYLKIPNYLFHDGNTDTFLQFGTDTITLRGDSGITLDGPVTANESISITGNLTASRLFSGDGGNKTNPMIANGSDQDTGIFFPAANTMAFTAGDTEALRFAGANSTFAGNVTAGGTLTVNGTGNSAFGGQVFINGLSNYTGLTLTGSGGSRPAINFNNVNNGVLGSIFGTEGNAIIISTNGGNAVTIDSSQNVGIGTDSPDVSGAGSSSTVLSVIETVGNRRGILELGDNQNADTGGIGSINFVGTYQDAGHKIMAEIRASGSGATSGQRGSSISMYTKENGTANIAERMRIASDGNIFMDSPKGSGENLNLVISDTTTGYAAGTGGSILFQGIFNSNNNLGGAAAIQASKTNSTDGDYSYDLDFYTRKLGSAIEKRMRIDSNGNVGIGTEGTNIVVTGKGLGIQNIGQDTTASMRLTGANATGNPGVATYTELKHYGADLKFGINHNGGTDVITINPSKNVGIGTTSPETQLSIGDYTDSAETITIATLSNGTGRINFYDNNNTEGGSIRVVGELGGSKMYFSNRWNTDNDRVVFDLKNGNVGIGTTNPSAALDIGASVSTNNIGAAIFHEESTTAYSSGGFNSRPTHTLYGINTANTYVGTRLSNAGNTEFFHGIVKGAANGEMTYVWQGYNGTAYQQFGAIDCYGTGVGTLTMAGDVVAYSDKKLKKNIKTLDGSKVYDMRGVSFTRKDTGKESSGVIAQEIQKIAPELVNNTDGTLGVAYGNLTGYLIEAIKELKAEIEGLKNKPCACNNCNCKE